LLSSGIPEEGYSGDVPDTSSQSRNDVVLSPVSKIYDFIVIDYNMPVMDGPTGQDLL